MKRVSSLVISFSILPALLVIPAFADSQIGDSENAKTAQWAYPKGLDDFSVIDRGYIHSSITGTYNVITGTGMRNVINGDVSLVLDNVIQETVEEDTPDNTGVYGSLFVGSDILSVPYVTKADNEHKTLQQKINGNLTLLISSSTINSNVAGHDFFQSTNVGGQELTNSGITGKTTITLNNNTQVKRGLYGVDFGASPIYSGVSFGDIELNINNSFVKEGVVAAGSNASAGNVVINVRGNSIIGYDSNESDAQPVDDAGWIVAGANSKGATIKSTLVNLDTNGDNTIKIGGAVYAGSRQRAGTEADPDTDENSVIGNATLNMFGGGDINIGGDVSVYHVGGKTALNLDDVDVTVGGTISDFQTINLGANAILTVDTLKMNSTDTMNIVLQDSEHYGKLNVGTLKANGATLNVRLGGAGEYNIMNTNNDVDQGQDFTWNLSNPLFNLVRNGNSVSAKAKSMNQITSEIGTTSDTANAMVAIAQSNDAIAKQISLLVQDALMHSNTEYVKREIAKLNPESAPVATSVAFSVQNHVLAVAGERMALPLIGRSGGDVKADYGVWAKGMYNTSKHTNVFSGNTYGASFGFDTDLNHSVILGAGYSYGRTNMDLKTHDADIDSNTVFVYGQYRNSDLFVNGTIAYTMSRYDWNKSVFGVANNPLYHVNALSEQVMGGYHFDNGITPTAGLRYMNIHQESYKDGITTVGATESTYLTGVAGLDYKYVWIAPDTSLFWTPNAHLAATYDMISSADGALVMIPGAAPYMVDSMRLSRLGGEFGIGLMAEYNYLTVALNYDLNLHRDFTSQTGSLKLKYKF